MARYHNNVVPPCNQDLYQNGICAGVYDPSWISSEEFEDLVRETREITSKSCDWHMFAGRMALKCYEEDEEVIVETFDPLYTILHNKRSEEMQKELGYTLPNTTGIYHGE